MNNYKQVFDKFSKNSEYYNKSIKSPDEAYKLLICMDKEIIYLLDSISFYRETNENDRKEYVGKIAELASENSNLHTLFSEAIKKYDDMTIEAAHWRNMYEAEKNKFKWFKKLFMR